MTDELLRIAEKGSLQLLRERLSRPPAPAQRLLDEALRHAVIRPRAKMAALLLEAGADPRSRGSENDQALAHAAMGGDPGLVEEMIRLGCDVNHANVNGRTPLVWAGWRGRVESVRILVAAGADIDHVPCVGGPAIYEAARSGHFDCVAELARLGARVDVTDEHDFQRRTPLMLAAAKGEAGCCALLLDVGADLERADQSGMHPLMHAAGAGDADTIRLFLERGADPSAKDLKGRTALGWASPFHPEAAALLAGRTGPIDEGPREERDTPLLHAAAAGALETVKLYLRHGAQVQPPGAMGRSALTVAVSLRRTSAIDHLLGLEQTDPDYPGDRKGFPALVLAARNGDLPTLQKLAAKGARIDIRDADGGTALHAAAHCGRPAAADWLHRQGLGLEDRDNRGRTPLARAAQLARISMAGSDYLGLLRWLVAAGTDLDSTDHSGFTPLMRLASRGRSDLLRVLLEAGADINRQAQQGETALSEAVFVGDRDERYRRPKRKADDASAEVIELLLRQGADPMPEGRSLLGVAQRVRCPHVVRVLRAAERRRAS